MKRSAHKDSAKGAPELPKRPYCSRPAVYRQRNHSRCGCPQPATSGPGWIMHSATDAGGPRPPGRTPKRTEGVCWEQERNEGY